MNLAVSATIVTRLNLAGCRFDMNPGNACPALAVACCPHGIESEGIHPLLETCSHGSIQHVSSMAGDPRET
jgi:hypothetical protein